METLIMDWQYSITEGPEKAHLRVQLDDIGRLASNHRPTVEFTLKQNDDPEFTLNALINGLKAEDGSGFSWLIYGYIPDSRRSFKGCYDTRYRTGWIKFN